MFIRHALMETEERGLLSRLLIDAPLLPKEIFDELKRACEDPGTSMVGLSTLGDLVIDRDGKPWTAFVVDEGFSVGIFFFFIGVDDSQAFKL